MKKFLFFLLMVFCMIPLTKAQNSCDAPTGLSAALHIPEWNNVTLSWNPVVDTTSVDLLWSARAMTTRVGADAAADFTGVVRFLPADLASHEGMSLSAVSFVPGEETSVSTFYIEIWQGGSVDTSGNFDPGTLLVEQQITTPLTISTLNTVLLNTPIAIDVTQELWIGIRCNTTAGFPLGASSNGNVADKGDVFFDSSDTSWTTLTNLSLTGYNWVIIGTLTDPTMALSGYKVYRDNTLQTLTGSTTYLDTLQNGTYVYEVTAAYVSGCESAPLTVSVTMADNPCTDCTDSVLIGNTTTSTTTQYIPTNPYYNYSYSQQIYESSLFSNVTGAITCLGFRYAYASQITRNMKIYMGNTSKNNFSSNTDWESLSNMFLVYDGPVVFSSDAAVNGYVNIPLATPFEWDGQSNIVLTCFDETGNYLSSGDYFYVNTTTGNKSLYVYRDASSYLGEATSVSGSLSTLRNDVRFMVGDAIACFMPSHAHVSNITDQTAELTWNTHGTEAGFEVVIVPEGSTLDNETPITVTDSNYTLTGLTDNTNYTVYLRANCSAAENSSWVTLEFRTTCVAVTQLPYVEDFDTYGTTAGAFPYCWTKMGNNTSYPSLVTTQHASGTSSVYFYSYYQTYSLVASQRLDLSDYTSDHLAASFKLLRSSSSYGRMDVGYMTDPSDISSFTLLKSIYASDFAGVNTWEEFIVDIPASLYSTPFSLAFYTAAPNAYNSNYVYLDDVKVDYAPTCSAPNALAVDAITGVGARLSWQAGQYGTPTYTVEYSEEGQNNYASVQTSNTYTNLTNLSNGTTYDVMVYATCDDTNSDTLTIQFTTQGCFAMSTDTTTLTYDTVGTGINTFNYLPSYSFYNYGYSQQIYLASELSGPGFISAISLNASTISQQRQYDIYMMHTNVATSSSWLPATSAQLVYTGSLNLTPGWNTFNFTNPFAYDGSSNLVLIMVDHTGSYVSGNAWYVHTAASGASCYAYQDGSPYSTASTPTSTLNTTYYRNNIIFTFGACDNTVTCVPPTPFILATDDESITIDWLPGNTETSWNLEYKEASDSVWVSDGVVSAHPYILSNLDANTAYDIRINSNCGATPSEWNTLSASTVCENIVSLPYSEGFDAATGNSFSSFIDCWTRGTNSSNAYPYCTTTQHTNGTHSLYFYGGSNTYSYAATSRFDDAIEMDSLLVQFNIFGTTQSYFIEAGIMTDPNDYSTFVSLGHYGLTSAGVWESVELDTRNYTGNGHYLAFRIPQWIDSYIYLDEVYVNYIPTCMHVTDVHAVNSTLTANSADITWTPGSSESSWEYLYGLDGTVDVDNDVPMTASNSTETISGLVANSLYEVYVRANCAGGDNSDWERGTFRTACAAITSLPYSENFDSYTGTTSTSPSTTYIPNCWDQYCAGSTYGTYPIIYNSSTYAASGNNALRFYVYSSTSYADQYAILPEIDTTVLQMNTLQLSFDARGSSTASYYNFKVIVGTVMGMDITTFVPVDTVDVLSTDYNSYEVPFNSYVGGGNRMAIRVPQTPSPTYYNNGYIDNVVIEAIPTCPRPSEIHIAGNTSSSLDVAWTPVGDETSWNLEYGPEGFVLGTGTMVAVTSPSYTANNLMDTTYDFYVQADCGGGDASLWRGPATGRPGTYLMAVTGTDAVTMCGGIIYDNGGANGDYNSSCSSVLTINPDQPGMLVVINGTYNTESSFDNLYIYDGVGTNGALLGSYSGAGTITALQSTTGPLTLQFSSDASVQYSGFEIMVSCVVAPTCIRPSNLHVTSTTSATVDLAWTENGTATTWNIEYGTPGFTPGTGTSLSVNTNPYTVTGLTEGTTYEFYVQSDCGGGDLSSWSDATSATPGSYNMPISGSTSLTMCGGVIYDDGGLNGNYSSDCDATLTINPVNAGEMVHLQGTYDLESCCDYLVLYDGNSTNGTVLYTTEDTESGTIDVTSTTGPITLYFSSDGSVQQGGFALIESCVTGGTPEPDPCEAPTNMTATGLTTESAILDWNQADATVNSWTINYKKASDATWTTIDVTAHPYTLTGLEYNTTYNAKVAANCDGTLSDFTSTITFKTAGEGVNDYTLANNISLYPNPTSGEFRIQNAELRIDKVEVYDVYGKMLTMVEVNDNQVTMNASNYAAGMYFVRIYTANGTATKTFVKK